MAQRGRDDDWKLSWDLAKGRAAFLAAKETETRLEQRLVSSREGNGIREYIFEKFD